MFILDTCTDFSHRYSGDGYGGHWWICIRDFKNNVWRSYNDKDVRVITEEEIFRKRDPDKEADAHLVVYVRDDRKDELCDPLHRVEAADDGNADAEGDIEMSEFASAPKGPEIEVREVEMKSLLD